LQGSQQGAQKNLEEFDSIAASDVTASCLLKLLVPY
jgi:hypothetical protein